MFGTQLQECVRREGPQKEVWISRADGVLGAGGLGRGWGGGVAGTRVGGSLLSLTVYDIEKLFIKALQVHQ